MERVARSERDLVYDRYSSLTNSIVWVLCGVWIRDGESVLSSSICWHLQPGRQSVSHNVTQPGSKLRPQSLIQRGGGTPGHWASSTILGLSKTSALTFNNDALTLYRSV